MKTKILILISFVLISFYSFSQTTCSTYYPFSEGSKFEITNFNKKGKKEGVVKYTITNVENNIATIEAIITDEKEKELMTTSYDIVCDGNSVSIDFKSLMNPEIFKQYKDMDIELTGTNIELPNNLEVGQGLKDANLQMSIDMGGIKMNMTINMLNRKVDAKESVTTSAGSFNCFALSYNSEMKMGIKQSYKIKEWVSEGVGVVKNETYNKKGKLMAYSELTSYTR